MAEPAPPDFVLDAKLAPTPDMLKPLYAAILGPGGTPTLSVGAVPRDEAVAWLVRAQTVYAGAVGRRSALVREMDLARRVELVGLADEQ